jgi:hypothetical protein
VEHPSRLSKRFFQEAHRFDMRPFYGKQTAVQGRRGDLGPV